MKKAQQPHLKNLRKLIKEHPLATANELSELTGWELAFTQKQISQLVSAGFVVSHPKRYEMAKPDNARRLNDLVRLQEFLQKKEEKKVVDTKELVDQAINNRSELVRAWG